MRLSDHLAAAADGFDEQAAYAREQGDPETAARSDRLAAQMRRLAGNHQGAAIWSGDPADDPPQVGVTADLVEPPNWVRDIRRSLGLSQAQFAAAINTAIPGAKVNRANVARWESGRVTPSPAMAVIIRQLGK